MSDLGCTSCRACESICKLSCVKVNFVGGGYNPNRNIEQCKNCMLCKTVCPERNPLELIEPLKCYAAYVKDNAVRKNSSSGGVATALMNVGLKNKMHVFACRMIDLHMEGEEVTEETLCKFKGSQYVESDISNIYGKIVEYLSKSENVMFIGLPCQVAAVKQYVAIRLKKNQRGALFTVDIVCHGTVPYDYFENHIKKIGHNKKFDSISMRSNRARYNYAFTLWNGERVVYSRKRAFSPYIYAFINNISLKEKCYTCQYSKSSRIGDITIGDFIGLNTGEIRYMFKQPSVILVNTERGREVFDWLQVNEDSLVTEEHTVEECIMGGPSFREPAKRNTKRDMFLQMYDKHGFDHAVKVACKKDMKTAQYKEIVTAFKSIQRRASKLIKR